MASQLNDADTKMYTPLCVHTLLKLLQLSFSGLNYSTSGGWLGWGVGDYN